MLFEVGETVVYPHHGAAKIIEVKKRTIRGEEKLYLKLNVTQGDLTIEVPADAQYGERSAALRASREVSYACGSGWNARTCTYANTVYLGSVTVTVGDPRREAPLQTPSARRCA